MLTETVLLEQNRRLREELDEARETIRQMKRALVLEVDAPLPKGIGRLTRSEEAVLRLLLSRKGTVTRETIFGHLYGDKKRSPKLVEQWVLRVRRKLAGTSISIVNDYARGYFIDRGDHHRDTRGRVVPVPAEDAVFPVINTSHTRSVEKGARVQETLTT